MKFFIIAVVWSLEQKTNWSKSISWSITTIVCLFIVDCYICRMSADLHSGLLVAIGSHAGAWYEETENSRRETRTYLELT